MADPAARLVVRAPNHLGELILALPALERSVRRESDRGAAAPLLQVTAWLRPLLELVGLQAELVPLGARRAVWRGARALRDAAGGAALRAITLTPSFSSVLLLRLAGAREVRGTAGGGRSALLTDAVDRAPLLEGHRVNEFLALCGFDASTPPEAPVLPEAAVARVVEAWQASGAAVHVRRSVSGAEGPTIGLFPGANGPARRWPVERFGELAARLGRAGARLLVFGGAGDSILTGAVAGKAGDAAFDLGGRTSLPELAGGLRSCDLLVTNDTGPMHLAAAVGCPVLALEGPADLRQTRPLGKRVRVVGRFDLPCVPCVKNACPRRGEGYVLPDAERECMYLIEVDEVEVAVQRMLSEEPA